jgi:hypothetical protein
MSINLTAWKFISEAEQVVCDYLLQHMPSNVNIRPALGTTEIKTPFIAVRNTSVQPFTGQASVVAHAQTRMTITVRTAMSEDQANAGRNEHNAMTAALYGCLMIIDETTGDNALPAELNAIGNPDVEFSMAAWESSSSGGDEDARHFVTRVELDTIIHPRQAEPAIEE